MGPGTIIMMVVGNAEGLVVIETIPLSNEVGFTIRAYGDYGVVLIGREGVLSDEGPGPILIDLDPPSAVAGLSQGSMRGMDSFVQCLTSC